MTWHMVQDEKTGQDQLLFAAQPETCMWTHGPACCCSRADKVYEDEPFHMLAEMLTGYLQGSTVDLDTCDSNSPMACTFVQDARTTLAKQDRYGYLVFIFLFVLSLVLRYCLSHNVHLLRGYHLYVFSRTRVWLAAVGDQTVDGQHLPSLLSDRSTPSPGELGATSAPTSADKINKDALKTACLDATSMESNDVAICTPTMLEFKRRQELYSNESSHARSKGGRVQPSKPTLVEEKEQSDSDDPHFTR